MSHLPYASGYTILIEIMYLTQKVEYNVWSMAEDICIGALSGIISFLALGIISHFAHNPADWKRLKSLFSMATPKAPEHHWLYKLLANPFSQGVLVFVALAIAFSGKLDYLGTIFCVIAAAVIGSIGLWTQHPRSRAVLLIIAYCCALALFGRYLVTAKEEALEKLRHSTPVKEFTVDWTIHLPETFDPGGKPNDAYSALSTLFCRPNQNSSFDIFLVPSVAAPFGHPKLIMDVRTINGDNDPKGCKLATSLITYDENNRMQTSRGGGYDLFLLAYEPKRHVLKLRSFVPRYGLAELRTPSFVVSDFGSPIPNEMYLTQVEGGIAAYWGGNLGNVADDQIVRSVDIVVRPVPSEGDLDSRWKIVAIGQPSLYPLNHALELYYQRQDLSRLSEFSIFKILGCQESH